MSNVQKILQKQRNYFATGETVGIDFRLKNLRVLRTAIQNHEAEILQALKDDLNKSPFEAYATEIGMLFDELRYILKHLRRWVSPKKVRTPWTQFLSTSYIYQEPYGVALIISPWNYPFQLCIAPLIGAIAAGNCAILKPSEFSPATSAVIARIIKENFAPEYITTVEGDKDVTTALLAESVDYIFFTGSVAVGKVVMEAAAKNLTPVTLELGGKSPCIVDATANLDMAARRIVWGKFLNAGQTCVAPDYVLVSAAVKVDLIKLMQKHITAFFGPNPHENSEYPRIVNRRHFDRLQGLLQKEKVVFGGQVRQESLHIAPTVVDGVNWDDPVMQDEIFGPILPVLEYQNLNQVIELINSRPKPLALYLFTTDSHTERTVLARIPFGGGCVNDTIVHLATPHMPFGGVGESGMGGYHGEATFRTFSHQKSVLKKSNAIDIPLRYPPYKNKLWLLKKIMR